MNYANNAYSVLSGGISDVATVINVATGTGSRFPASNFLATLVGYDVNGNENAWEIVLCTSRTSDALTVTRAQEGTTAVAWADATRIENRVTAGTMADFEPGITAGTTSQYWRGDKSWRDFFTDVRAATLTGLSTATNAVISAADTVLGALGKIQAQITAHTANTSNPHGVTKAQVGLGNVDNTSDVNKPVSTATQTALDAMAPLASPALTGTPTAPTAAVGTNTTQLATTAHVFAERAATTTLSNKTLASPISTGVIYDNGSARSNIVAVAALNIDCSLGNYFTKTINAASTFTFSNAPASQAYAFTLELTHTSGAVTWPASVAWPGNTAPTLTAGKTHLFTFVTDNGGTRWRGVVNADYQN